MKVHHFHFCLYSFMLAIIFSASNHKTTEKGIPEQIINSSTSMSDSIWKVKPIAKLGDPALGTDGNFEEFNRFHYLESGAFVFWARYGKKKLKDWAFYSYKNGNLRIVFKSEEKFSEPDGIPKEFDYAVSYALELKEPQKGPEASSKLFYLSGGQHFFGSSTYIYSWDGEKLTRVIGEGDKISLPGNREVIIKTVSLVNITNDNQAMIIFNGEKPDNIRGVLLHNGSSLKPIFIDGEELPGLSEIKVNDLVMDLYIFNDTILAKLDVKGGGYKHAVFRFTKNNTEILSSTTKFLGNFYILNAAGPDNFIIDSLGSILHYKKGKRNTILKNVKELPDSKGFTSFEIGCSGFFGPENESILFCISLIKPNPYFNFIRGVPEFFYYTNSKLSKIPPSPSSLSPLDFDPELIWRTPFMLSLFGVVYVDPVTAEPTIISAPKLKTEVAYSFNMSDIIAMPSKSRIIVEDFKKDHTGFYELTK